MYSSEMKLDTKKLSKNQITVLSAAMYRSTDLQTFLKYMQIICKLTTYMVYACS